MKQYGEWQGTIGKTLAESQPWFPEPPHPGEDAPNVVIVLLDDLGFAQLGCYGSDIDTPNIDALAANGLRYTNFHVTPLCSPTRAALLTGRNHHSVGMRAVSNFNTGFPNMTGHISNHAATLAEVLHDEGYATFAVGKWHLAPMEECSAAGPMDQWPLQRGFDRYYGFLEGETDQFSPSLTYDNHPIERARPGRGRVPRQRRLDRSSRSASCTTPKACDPTGLSSCMWRSGRPMPRIRRRPNTSRNTAGVTTRAGTSCGPAGSPTNSTWE